MRIAERLEHIDAEIDRRIDLVSKIESGGADGIATAMAYYGDHPIAWMSDFLWGYDPRNKDLIAHKGTEDEQALPVYVPMVLCEVQRELVEWMIWIRREHKHGYVPKSRGVGLSYYACALETYWWLFEDAFSGTLLANKEELVDNRSDPDSLFQKCRIILEFVPAWMLPPQFSIGVTSEHDNHRRLINPENASTLVGKIGKSPGRGGRGNFTFVDEAAHIDDLTSVRRAIRDNSDCTIEGSTYQGTGEPFYRSSSKGGPYVFKITWEDIPWYDEEWFERAKAKYDDDPAGFAQEILADPTASVPDLVIPAEWVRSTIQFEGWYRRNRKKNPRMLGTKIAGLDIAGYGSNLTVLLMRSGAVVESILDTTEGNVAINAYWAHDEGARYGLERIAYDDVGMGQGIGDTWGASAKDRPRFAVLPFQAGGQPTDFKWPNGLTSRERFANLRSEMWWHIRERCRKSYETRNGIRAWPPSECLSLPLESQKLAEQLSQPKEIRDKRRIMVESKKDMRDRGIPSPDFADALIMSEYCLRADVESRGLSALDRVKAIHGARAR